ncbi:aminomethyltransferase family protein [Haloarchaeobius sp. DFWS5]|uniref:CAF17-like 4Fe-4S cluster assembly/insertion protein YgfZ n=1 Tax=Haloarchaeobius sp. DFWS5 TaxID=3446114 RepID=UPI003EBD483C
MTVIESVHADHGATFGERGGRTVVEHYGRPERVHKAVRNGVGLIEMAYGVVVVEGEDKVEFVDNAVSNRVPDEDGEGCYALLLDPQGKIWTDLYVYNAGERLLLFTPPQTAEDLVEDWQEKVFIQDVDLRVATDDFAVFGVHGPKSTEKVASVLNHAGSPEPHLSFVRGSMGDEGVTVICSDAPTGEEGYEVVCAADDAERVFGTLANHGLNAAPFGYQTWDALTLEAGTPLFDTELDGTIPNVLGLRNAVDFEKGCFVGQEVVSRVENRGQPSKRLVGLEPEAVPESGAAVFDGDAAIGEVTRAVDSPTLDRPIALALVAFDSEATDLSVRVEGSSTSATRVDLPFVDGSDTSDRLPKYLS